MRFFVFLPRNGAVPWSDSQLQCLSESRFSSQQQLLPQIFNQHHPDTLGLTQTSGLGMETCCSHKGSWMHNVGDKINQRKRCRRWGDTGGFSQHPKLSCESWKGPGKEQPGCLSQHSWRSLPGEIFSFLLSSLYSLLSIPSAWTEGRRGKQLSLGSRSLGDVLSFLFFKNLVATLDSYRKYRKRLRETQWIQDPACPAWHCKSCWFTAALPFTPTISHRVSDHT